MALLNGGQACLRQLELASAALTLAFAADRT